MLNHAYTSRSNEVLAANTTIKLVVRRSRWEVGNGKRISVWDDKWVSGLVEPLRASCGETVGAARRVDELVVPGPAYRWDEAKIEELVGPFLKGLGLKTPIGGHGRVDEMVWGFDDKGVFSVKSAYLLDMGYYTQNPHVSSPDKKLWGRLVWNVNVPPKVKIFLWRACSNYIPTAANLLAHHVPGDGICGLCGGRWGSTEHYLLFCPRVARVWRESRFTTVTRGKEGMQLVDLAAAVRGEMGEDDYAVWVMLVWKLWSYICCLLHPTGDRMEQPSEMECVAALEAYRQAGPTVRLAAKLGVELGSRKWLRPRKGCYRVDVDALYNMEAGVYGVGVVIRDDEGRLVVAMAKRRGRRRRLLL